MNVHVDFSGRAWTVAEPLEAAGHTVVEDWLRADVTLTDSPPSWWDSKPRGPTFYRPRGDYWKLMADKPLGRWRARLRGTFGLASCQGIVAPGPYLAAKARQLTRQRTVAEVGLPVDAAAWPAMDHTDDELCLLTLTNMDYWDKVAPLLTHAAVVDDVLRDVGGRWVIGGDGEHYDRVAGALDRFTSIQTPGFVPAKPHCRRANVMLHLSGMDIALPNAVLEGMASGLPVIVGPFVGFAATPAVQQVAGYNELASALRMYTDPGARRAAGRRGLEYVRAQHHPERIGERLAGVLSV